MAAKLESLVNHLAETPVANRLLLAWSILMLSAESFYLASGGDVAGAGFLGALAFWPALLGTTWRWNRPGHHRSVIGTVVSALTPSPSR